MTDRPVGERSQYELLLGLGQGPEQVGTGLRVGSHRDQDTQLAWVDGPQREAETAGAGLIQPLQVVEDQRDGLGLAELGEQTPNRKRYGQRVDLAAIGFGTLQRDRQRTLLRSGQAIDRALRTLVDQLRQTCEGQPAVELGRRHGQHPPAATLRQLIRDLQQTALAEPRFADDDRTAALIQDLGQHPDGIVAAEQSVGGRRYLVHQHILRYPARPIEGRPALDRGFSPLR